MPVLAAAAASVGFGVTWILVQWLGLEGGAWGTALTALISLILAGYASQRFLHVPVNWVHLAVISIVIVAGVATLSSMPAFALSKGSIALLIGIGALLVLKSILKGMPLASADERWDRRAAESAA
jgi:hypothetical protein